MLAFNLSYKKLKLSKMELFLSQCQNALTGAFHYTLNLLSLNTPTSYLSPSVSLAGRQLSVRYEGGMLFYDGERFSKGNNVLLEVSDDSPAQSVSHLPPTSPSLLFSV